MQTPYHLLIHTITIQRPTLPTDTAGGAVHTYANHLANIPARAQPAKGSESNISGGVRGSRPATIFVAGGQDIQERDRIVWTDPLRLTVRRFDIESAPDYDGLGVLMQLEATEVEGIDP